MIQNLPIKQKEKLESKMEKLNNSYQFILVIKYALKDLAEIIKKY